MPEKVGGVLWVGRNEDHEVVINHPDLKPDENGMGHIVFSARQARGLAGLLIQHASWCELEALRASHAQLVKIAEAAKLFCVVTKQHEFSGGRCALRAVKLIHLALHEAVAECFGPGYWRDSDG